MKATKYLFLVTICFLFSCTEDVDDPTKQLGSIAGIVYDKVTTAPVSGVNLKLEPGDKSTVTGSDGTYSFNDLQQGAYTIKLSKDGYKDNSVKMTVAAGIRTEGDIMIERIPATMITDKDTLDFGIDQSLNSLSFSIVNRDYATLFWNIGGLEDWIIVDPMFGELASGKTATVIVTINRNNEIIKPGDNNSTIIIRSSSGHGSAEIHIKVTGEVKEDPAVTINDATQVTSSTAILKGIITNPGIPSYWERGFYYSDSSIDPTQLENNPNVIKKTYPVNDTLEYSVTLTGLEIDKVYYARSYVINKHKHVISTNEIEFKTFITKPRISIKETTEKDVSQKRAKLNGYVDFKGDPEYSEKGFIYGQTTYLKNGKIVKVEGSGEGDFNTYIEGIELDKTYYVWAYIIQRSDTIYNDTPVSFSLDTTQPSVSVQTASSIDVEKHSAVLNGAVTNVGNPLFTEKGFVYSLSPAPTVNDNKIPVEGLSSGIYSVSVTGLELDKTYYVRTYVCQLGKTYYSNETVNITLSRTTPSFQMKSISELSYSAKEAKITGTISDAGIPVYSRRGFVYGFESNPTIENDRSQTVTGTSTGDFSLFLTNLTTERQYFVKAFVEQEGKIYYSTNELKFTLAPVAAQLGSFTISEINNNSAKVSSSVTIIGDPAYTERGFVYNTDGNPELEMNLGKIVDEGSSSENYSGRITGLTANTTYYAKAYVKQNGQIYYSAEKSFKTSKLNPIVTATKASEILYTSATINANVSFIGDPAFTELGFYFGTDSYPTDNNSQKIIVEDANDRGDYSATINGLSEGTRYYYCAYTLQEGEPSAKRSNTIEFTTGYKPKLETGDVELNYNGKDKNNEIDWMASFSGYVSDFGDPEFTDFGFVYGTNKYPDPDDGSSVFLRATDYSYTYHSSYHYKDRMYTLSITGFKSDIQYYVRAVAVTPYGKVFGEPKEFTPTIIAPTIQTLSVSDVTCAGTEEGNLNWSIVVSGKVLQYGTPNITSFGFLIGTYNDPKIDDGTSIYVPYSMKIYDNTPLYSAISGLKTNVNYYFRAVAETPIGYIYGATFSFTPQVIPPQLSMNEPTIGIRDGVWFSDFSCEIKSKGIPSTTRSANDYGFVISQQSNPTIGDGSSTTIQCDNAIVDHDNFYAFRRGLLIANKTYYVRAYAKTILGYTYSDEWTFKTY